MNIVRVQHPVLDFDRWKTAFDSDPVGREQAGVRRYTVSRAADDPALVLIDLELDSREAAGAMVESLQQLWQKVEGVLIKGPRARILDVVEVREL